MPLPPLGRTLSRAAVVALATGLTVTVPTGSAGATPWPHHPDRSLVRYVVRPGDTATGLAVRYHAWTAELIALNHLGSTGALHQGQTIRIPVVVSAVRGHAAKHRKHQKLPPLINRTTPPKGWRDANLSRDEVRSLVARMAQHYGVPPVMALAVAWQESGWQQRRISKTGAIGVMQVMPGTGQWMRWYAGRPLRLRDTRDNIQAGVLTLRTLRSWTKKDVTAIAAYYQGLRSVRHRGWFDDTKLYVRNVLAHERRLAHGLPPR